MSHTNRYHIINADDPNMDEINAVIVGTPETQRYSIDDSLIVIKLHQGDHNEYTFLADYPEQGHSEILESLNNYQWKQPIP